MSGAKPLYLTLSLIIEAGMLMSDLIKIIESVRETAKAADIKIVAGDTKVVDKGEADQLFINTAGIGVFENPSVSIKMYVGTKNHSQRVHWKPLYSPFIYQRRSGI